MKGVKLHSQTIDYGVKYVDGLMINDIRLERLLTYIIVVM